jgi:hypothetical protein
MKMIAIMVTSRPMSTKKLLVAFDPSRVDAAPGDFVVPILDAEVVSFFGLGSKKPCAFAVMVYVGKEVTVNDLFAKLVDAGQEVPNVDRTVKMLVDYMSRLEEHKIGNVVAIEPAAEEPCGFRLKRVANTPSGVANAT